MTTLHIGGVITLSWVLQTWLICSVGAWLSNDGNSTVYPNILNEPVRKLYRWIARIVLDLSPTAFDRYIFKMAIASEVALTGIAIHLQAITSLQSQLLLRRSCSKTHREGTGYTSTIHGPNTSKWARRPRWTICCPSFYEKSLAKHTNIPSSSFHTPFHCFVSNLQILYRYLSNTLHRFWTSHITPYCYLYLKLLVWFENVFPTTNQRSFKLSEDWKILL